MLDESFIPRAVPTRDVIQMEDLILELPPLSLKPLVQDGTLTTQPHLSMPPVELSCASQRDFSPHKYPSTPLKSLSTAAPALHPAGASSSPFQMDSSHPTIPGSPLTLQLLARVYTITPPPPGQAPSLSPYDTDYRIDAEAPKPIPSDADADAGLSPISSMALLHALLNQFQLDDVTSVTATLPATSSGNEQEYTFDLLPFRPIIGSFQGLQKTFLPEMVQYIYSYLLSHSDATNLLGH